MKWFPSWFPAFSWKESVEFQRQARRYFKINPNHSLCLDGTLQSNICRQDMLYSGPSDPRSFRTNPSHVLSFSLKKEKKRNPWLLVTSSRSRYLIRTSTVFKSYAEVSGSLLKERREGEKRRRGRRKSQVNQNQVRFWVENNARRQISSLSSLWRLSSRLGAWIPPTAFPSCGDHPTMPREMV